MITSDIRLAMACWKMSGWFQGVNSNINSYFTLDEDNEQLMVENIALQQDLLKVRKEVQYYKGLLAKDSLLTPEQETNGDNEQFEFIPARVIRNSTDQNYNYITLNKGRSDGVKKDMGVISPQGIVGKVIDVSEHYCLVLSAINVSSPYWSRPFPRMISMQMGMWGFMTGMARIRVMPSSPIFPKQ